MTAKYDLENLLADVKAIMVANINTKLVEIDTEKGDLTMAPIDNDAYFEQSLTTKTANWDQFILYGISDIESDGKGPMTLQKVSVQIVLILSDFGNDPDINKRVLRYGRALKEIFEKNWKKISGRAAQIKTYRPIEDPLDDVVFRMIAIDLETSID